MNISIEQVDLGKADWVGKHILTVAEVGFSMLTIYGNQRLEVPDNEINAFAGLVSRDNEFKTLHPRYPLSAIPNRYFREHSPHPEWEVICQFQNDLQRFLRLNQQEIGAASVLVDFHVSSAAVPEAYLTAALEVFERGSGASVIQELMLIS